jgi:hypothetical protein
MHAMLWTASTILAGLIALVIVVAARRTRPQDLGSLSGSWIAEQRATNDRGY